MTGSGHQWARGIQGAQSREDDCKQVKAAHPLGSSHVVLLHSYVTAQEQCMKTNKKLVLAQSGTEFHPFIHFNHRISSSMKGQEASGASSSCLGAKAAPIWTRRQFILGPHGDKQTFELRDNSEWPIVQRACCSWTVEGSQRRQRDKGRTCNVHTAAPALGITTVTF